LIALGRPTKRSVTIAGHETTVSLEPMFWVALEAAADEEKLPLSALIARIDAERLDSKPPPNLTSALRQWLLARAERGQS
jgi:predicted DNA-binding ribbon-helix-helix protein